MIGINGSCLSLVNLSAELIVIFIYTVYRLLVAFVYLYAVSRNEYPKCVSLFLKLFRRLWLNDRPTFYNKSV